MKTCTKCLQEKPLEEFYRIGASRTAKTADGLFGECKVCNRARAREWQRQKRASDPTYASDVALRSNYGITLAEYEALLAEQGGGCAICGVTEPGGRGKRFHVDHDHETGAVRALLCHGCNTGLGAFGDDVDRLMSAVAYLLSRQDVLGAVTF
jgi:Autographiviridae endonuclease VII